MQVNIVAVGITNQRETTLLWDRRSGAPLHNAIVWLDTRTAVVCERMAAQLDGGSVSQHLETFGGRQNHLLCITLLCITPCANAPA